MEKLRIGIGGSAANPPHLGHKYLIEALIKSKRFDRIFWIPSGERPDKKGFVSAEHRVAMTKMTFPKEWPFEIIYDDVYGRNTPTIEVFEKYMKKYPDADIVWFTGVDSVVPLEKFGGKCEMQVVWIRGEELYNNFRFVILSRPGFANPKSLDLPSNFEIMDVPQLDITSTEIKRRIQNNESIDDLVTDEVAKYIEKNNLYRD
jgi:nicotinate-nucleotide adenylyltransferase